MQRVSEFNNEINAGRPGLQYEPMKVKLAMHTAHDNTAVVELQMEDPQFPVVSIPYNSRELTDGAKPSETLGTAFHPFCNSRTLTV